MAKLSDEGRRAVEAYLERVRRPESLLRSYFPGSVRFARGMKMDTADIRQACRVGVCEAAERWVTAWDGFGGLFVVQRMRYAVVRDAKSRYRINLRKGADEWEITGGEVSDLGLPDRTPEPVEEVAADDQLTHDYATMHDAMSEASPLHRSLFVMRYNDLFGGRPYSLGEVGVAFGVNKTVVRWAVESMHRRVRSLSRHRELQAG